MQSKVKGYVCGIAAAIFYGTNPLGALHLYADGIDANSVLFYRFAIAVAVLGVIMLVTRKRLGVSKRELALLAVLGVIFSTSSMSLYSSFYYMDAGIASTILFVYPVMVAVIMAVFFKERLSSSALLAMVLALVGIALLYRGDGGTSLSGVGVALVMLSSLSYAVYIVVVNKSPLRMSSVKLSFYVLFFGMLTILVCSAAAGDHIRPLTTPAMWMWALLLGVVPTVLSLVLMVVAVNEIGSTPTAVMGALEPLTAVVIGVTVFGEALTPRLVLGILLILTAVMVIVAGGVPFARRVWHVMGLIGRVVTKRWRWR